MSLADLLTAAPTTRQLRVDIVLSELDKVDAATLRAALHDPRMPANRIEAALERMTPPVTLSSGAIRLWRKRNDVG
jgi:hypothetical protein